MSMKQLRRHPFSALVSLVTRLAALCTAVILGFLVAYILVNGVPNLRPALFSLTYTSENQSMLPAIINTCTMTMLSLLLAVPVGVGRAMGETMAVIMIAGNQPRMPKGIFQGIRTLTGNIVMEMGYATGLHREALIATGVVLFTFILIINLAFSALKRRERA